MAARATISAAERSQYRTRKRRAIILSLGD